MANQFTLPEGRRKKAVKEAQETAFTDLLPTAPRNLERMADWYCSRTSCPLNTRGYIQSAYQHAYQEVFQEEGLARIAAGLSFAAGNSPEEGEALYLEGLRRRRSEHKYDLVSKEPEGPLVDFLTGVWRGAYEAERLAAWLRKPPS